jgi:hypothetical protein
VTKATEQVQPFVVTAPVTVETENVLQMLESAFSGGSNYWYDDVAKGSPPTETRGKDDWGWYAWDAVHGGSVIVTADDGSGVTKRYTLNREALDRGLVLMAQKSRKHFMDALDGDTDADTGDTFLQYCLFGEVVYG